MTVKDAWEHGTVGYTTTGVFGKSSNVGTLMLAQRVGEDRFADMLEKFGVGQATGIELPSESEGLLPARSQWSGGTFANLPIGQGMSVTLLQMAGIYQAIANDGERIEPRIVKKITDANGVEQELPEAKRTRVVSPQTAQTVAGMFQSVVQSDSAGVQQGTGAAAAVDGYQVAGKTGTAQQVDPACNCYSNSKYWITFAGLAPVDNPRFVVGLMLDARSVACMVRVDSRPPRCSTILLHGCLIAITCRFHPSCLGSWYCRLTECGGGYRMFSIRTFKKETLW